jgi:hypothetical protein
MSVLALSKSGTFQLSAHVERQRSMLIAEGVATRVQWLLAADNHLFPNEAAGETDYSVYEEHDRFLSDGVKHIIDYYGEKVQVTITDTISGHDIINNRSKILGFFTNDEDIDEEEKEDVTLLQTKINDYIDSNDDVSNEGMEESDYESEDMKPLPRNGNLQFREELLYIPGFRDLFSVDKDGMLSSVRLIPPENTVTISGNPSLLTATKQEIMNYCNIDDEDELEAIMQAVKEWKEEKVPLSDGSLDPLLLGRLNNLPRTESGIYTVKITADESDPRPFKRLIFSFQASPVAGPSDKIIQYLQWMFY